MLYNSAREVLDALAQAYYVERNPKKVLSCVTDDIEWIGTEEIECFTGKDAVAGALAELFRQMPSTLRPSFSAHRELQIAPNATVFTFQGTYLNTPNIPYSFNIRASVCCVKSAEGWLVKSLHLSVPNIGRENYALKQKLTGIEERKEILQNSIPGGTAIYRIKKDGTVPTEYISSSIARICGYDNAAEFLERIRDNAKNEIPADEWDDLLGAVLHALETGEPISVKYHIYTKSHSKLTVNMNANTLSDETLADDELAVLYAVHTLPSEQDLREQRHYRTIIDMLGIAYWEWTREHGFFSTKNYGNYALSQAPVEDVRNNKVFGDIIHPDDTAKLKDFFSKGDNQQPRASVIIRMKLVDGTYQWTEIFGFKEYSDTGETTRLSCVMRNIEEAWVEQKRQLEHALAEAKIANRAKTDFLSRVSHDMRTPLNGILGLTTLLKDTVTDGGVLRDLDELEMSGNYLLELINDTLDMSRIENGKLELHPIVFDGKTLFENCISLAKSILKGRNIHLTVRTQNIPFTLVYVDVSRFEQALINVFSNAVKFTPDGGSIDLCMSNISVEGDVITDKIVIRDTGIGMSPEFLPHIFEPFSQEDPSRTGLSQGTGLGMAITKQILQLTGGDITVESDLGKGSCFTLTFKLHIATAAQAAEWNSTRGAMETGLHLSGKRVLLCEDHPLNAQIAIRLLHTKGIEVEHAENGQIGVELFRHSAPDFYDAILMDIRMPVMDGLEAARTIRSLPRKDARLIPIIAMTANAFADDIEKTQAAGMDAHLSKPIQVEHLFETLEEQISNRHRWERSKILIVDDMEINRAAMRVCLEQDFEILEAENGAQAIELIQRTRGLDAVITDIQMPEMDGVELIRRIRSDPGYRHIVIIANTQFGDSAQEETLLALGADDFVYKPTSPKLVAIRVRNTLRRT